MSLFSQLKQLQWKQLQHDEKYHKEIWLLTVQQRITHMVLHLSKYSAKLTTAAYTNDHECIEKTVIDAMIISISSANIFNKPLIDLINQEYLDASSLSELAHGCLDLKRTSSNSTLGLAIEITGETGKLCKAVESLDHLESFAFKEKILESISVVFELLLALTSLLKIDNITQRIATRLFSVESKSMFFEELGNYRDGYT